MRNVNSTFPWCGSVLNFVFFLVLNVVSQVKLFNHITSFGQPNPLRKFVRANGMLKADERRIWILRSATHRYATCTTAYSVIPTELRRLSMFNTFGTFALGKSSSIYYL